MASPSLSAAPSELGRVAWLRNFDEGMERARASGKPLFLLFQEVPGCSTCVAFGENVLDHALLVEAIEDEFVPVAILNNRGGHDREILAKFGEPAWNNPVVRFVDAAGRDLLPRRDRLWRPAEIAERMIAALEVAKRPVPAYLRALYAELDPKQIERATLAMHCYWKGEACLGDLPGVLESRAGDLGGREVVELRYDATRLSYGQLLRAAADRGCADSVFAHDDAQLAIARPIFEDNARRASGRARPASPDNQKFHLKRRTPKARKADVLEGLTPAQATRMNALAWKGLDPSRELSPRQRDQHKR